MNSLVSQAPVTETRPFIRKIVVAVDLTARSLATAEYAVAVAKSFGASLIFVYVHPTESMFNFVNDGGYSLIDREQHNQRHALTSLTDMVSKDYPFCSQTFLIGDPAEGVVSYAQEIDADLIIAASHHPSFLASAFHFDQAPKMIRQATCPVLVYQGEEGSGEG
jgi:nucleotide-binding universal stress UspA family protein